MALGAGETRTEVRSWFRADPETTVTLKMVESLGFVAPNPPLSAASRARRLRQSLLGLRRSTRRGGAVAGVGRPCWTADRAAGGTGRTARPGGGGLRRIRRPRRRRTRSQRRSQAEEGALAAGAFEGPQARWAARASRVWASPTESPDRVERADPLAECSSCGERIGDAADVGEGWAQVWDIPPIEIEKVHWLLPQAALRLLREDAHRRSAVRPARPGLLWAELQRRGSAAVQPGQRLRVERNAA